MESFNKKCKKDISLLMIIVLSIILISVITVSAPVQLAHAQKINSRNVFKVANTPATIQAIGTAAPGNKSSPLPYLIGDLII